MALDALRSPRRLISPVVGALFLFVGCSPAAAQSPLHCLPTPLMAEALVNEGGFKPAFAGIDDAGLLVEIWVHPDIDRWAFITTDPMGWSCLVGTGSRWSLPPIAERRGEGL